MTKHIAVDEILRNFGDIETFKLDNVIDNSACEDDIPLIVPSYYYGVNQIPIKLTHKNNLNVLTLNCQSINAKFDNLVSFLDIMASQNVYFHVICLQETWLQNSSDTSLFNLNGYQCFLRDGNVLDMGV